MTELKPRIVVMGGSFNPPTIAHLRLLQAAVDGVGADLGYFVPTSKAYLKRKMRHATDARMCLPEDVRLEMLTAMCAEDPRLRVADCEFGTVKPCSYETMVALQSRHPTAELYFVIGGDKVTLVPRWRNGAEFLQRFGYVVFDRGDAARARLAELGSTRIPLEKFLFVQPPEGVEAVSSTEVRRRYFAGEDYAALLHPAVTRVLGRYCLDDFPLEIDAFGHHHRYLTREFKCKIRIADTKYPSVDAAYRALSAGMPETARLDIMMRVLREKFRQHPELAALLRQTGNRTLVAAHSSHEEFWGVNNYTWKGENNYGKLLMQMREELK